MNNPTACHSIRNKMITKDTGTDTGLAISSVNQQPASTVHLQRCYSDQSTTVAIQKTITEIWGTQYGGTTAGVITLPSRTTNKRFEVNTTVAGLVINVELTLINELNEEVTETLTTNGTTYVATTGSNYKVCNDMRITSPRALTGTERVWCRAQGGTQNNIYYVVLTATDKFNPVFMVGSKNGVVRKARLIGMPQIYSQAVQQLNVYVFPNGGATPSLRLFFNQDPGTSFRQITLARDGLVELTAGEWCVFHRGTATSVNTTVAVTARWEIFNA